MESKGRFQGSIWLGIHGLQWALNEVGKLKSISSTQSGIFQFRRDCYRTLEFSVLLNRGGRFVELSEYHGGSQRGSIRIPEGRQGRGWAMFVAEVRKYYLEKVENAERQPQRERKTRVVSTVAPGAHVERNGRNSNSTEKSRKSWGREFRSEQLAHKIQPHESRVAFNGRGVNSRVPISTTEPRPTRVTQFKWRKGRNALQITKIEGQHRYASWVGPITQVGPSNTNGPEVGSLLDPEEDSLDPDEGELKSDGNAEILPKHFGLEVGDPIGEVGEVNSCEEPGDPIGEEIAIELDMEVQQMVTPMSLNQLRCSETMVAEDPRPATELPLVRVDLVKGFSGKDFFTEPVGPLLLFSNPGIVDFDSMLAVLEFQPQNEVAQCDCEQESLSPMICEPLAMVAPVIASDSLGKKHTIESEWSKWVNHQYRGICKLVGFPIDSHEEECLALLRKIEVSRPLKKGTKVSRKVVGSGTRGARQLRNLASSVNYEGRNRVCG